MPKNTLPARLESAAAAAESPHCAKLPILAPERLPIISSIQAVPHDFCAQVTPDGRNCRQNPSSGRDLWFRNVRLCRWHVACERLPRAGEARRRLLKGAANQGWFGGYVREHHTSRYFGRRSRGRHCSGLLAAGSGAGDHQGRHPPLALGHDGDFRDDVEGRHAHAHRGAEQEGRRARQEA